MTVSFTLSEAKILILDDEVSNVRLLEVTLQEAGYRNVFGLTDSREALTMFAAIEPDLLLLDLNMPFLDGLGVIRGLKHRLQTSPIPILVLTADATSSAKYQALEEGATDFLTKPFDSREVLLRIRNMLEIRFHGITLERKVQERTRELQVAQLETFQRLARAAEYRDDQTGLHASRVGILCGRIAQVLGLPQEEIQTLEQAATLHDVGKIGISDSILLKPGKLTAEEFEAMKGHTKIGASILSGSTSSVLQLAEVIAMNHHEKWDGSGYWGLKGEAIPLSGRIVAVADAFDAMTEKRVYKSALSVDESLDEIRAQSGRHFDPRIAEAFLSLFNQPANLPGGGNLDLLSDDGDGRAEAI